MTDKTGDKIEGAAPRRDGAAPSPHLDEALNALEHILEDRHVVTGEPARAVSEPGPLPLLKEVIVPGDPPVPFLPLEQAHEEADMQEDLPPHDDLVRRLVSEMQVIIEGCVDAALADAKQELMTGLKNHLDIVLPEILAELERRRDDEWGPAEPLSDED